MHVYIRTCSFVRFNVLFSESSVRQAVYRTWGKVICIQIHSPSNEHSEAEGCTVHQSGDLALLCQSYVLGKFGSLRLEVW